MTTLYKAVEAAKEALKLARAGSYDPDVFNEALSTLPAKPMPEDELYDVVSNYARTVEGAMITAESWSAIKMGIRALRDAGVLYCVEEK